MENINDRYLEIVKAMTANKIVLAEDRRWLQAQREEMAKDGPASAKIYGYVQSQPQMENLAPTVAITSTNVQSEIVVPLVRKALGYVSTFLERKRWQIVTGTTPVGLLVAASAYSGFDERRLLFGVTLFAAGVINLVRKNP